MATNKRQTHYQIAGFTCNLCFKEIRVLYLLKDRQRSMVCESCAQSQATVLRTCVHCENRCQGIAVVEHVLYPMREIHIQTLEEYEKKSGEEPALFFNVKRDPAKETWCPSCVEALFQQQARNEVDVFDFITMDPT